MSDWTTTKSRHGTTSGWSMHQRLGERPCRACYLAKQTYDKRQRAAPEKAIRNRLHAKAQIRAFQELARRHPDEYRAAYQRHKQELLP